MRLALTTTAALACIALLTGCTSWTIIATPRPGTAIEGRPDSVRLSRSSDGAVILHHPIVRGDTIVGFATDQSRLPDSRVAIPLTDVTMLERIKLSGSHSTILVASIVIGVLVAGVLSLYSHP
jgi:hypothetical protein